MQTEWEEGTTCASAVAVDRPVDVHCTKRIAFKRAVPSGPTVTKHQEPLRTRNASVTAAQVNAPAITTVESYPYVSIQ